MFFRIHDILELDCQLIHKRRVLLKEEVREAEEYKIAQSCIHNIVAISELLWVKGAYPGRFRFRVVDSKAVWDEFNRIKLSCPRAYIVVSPFLDKLEFWELDKEAEGFYPFIGKENPSKATLVYLYFSQLQKNPYFVEDVLKSEYGWVDEEIIEGILWKIKEYGRDLKIKKLNPPSRVGGRILTPEHKRVFAERINIYWELFKENVERVKERQLVRNFDADAEAISAYEAPTGRYSEFMSILEELLELSTKASEYRKSDYMKFLKLDMLGKALIHVDKLVQEREYNEASKVLQQVKVVCPSPGISSLAGRGIEILGDL